MQPLTLLKKLVPNFLHPSRYLRQLVLTNSQECVLRGPFRTMLYTDAAVGSAFFPKLIGCYERELQETIETIIKLSPATVIDIGAAEGYYAVGLALRIPNAKVIAFEMDERGRCLLQELIRLNHQENQVEVRGQATIESLRTLINQEAPVAVICDCEGAESHLLDPEKITWLATANILVEIHPWVDAKIDESLLHRFGDSHAIQRIDQTQRTPQDFPFSNWYTRLIPKRYLDAMVAEGRPIKMHWYWMVPK